MTTPSSTGPVINIGGHRLIGWVQGDAPVEYPDEPAEYPTPPLMNESVAWAADLVYDQMLRNPENCNQVVHADYVTFGESAARYRAYMIVAPFSGVYGSFWDNDVYADALAYAKARTL